MHSPRIITAMMTAIVVVAGFTVLFLSGSLTSRAVQNPSISLDTDTTGNTYDDTTNTMTVGTIDNCLETAAPGNNAQHNHTAHVVVQNVEDMIGWQVRLNYDGTRFAPISANFTPFSDNNTGQSISFVNLPLDAGTHRELVTGTSGLNETTNPATALVGSNYNGAQNAPVSPDTPAKTVPDDMSYSAPTGGVLASLTLQVRAGQDGQALFMDADDNNPNGPGSKAILFSGTGQIDVDLADGALGDGIHTEGLFCSQVPTPTPTPTETQPPTATPTITPPDHDHFDSAVVISALPFSDSISTIGATRESQFEPSPCGGIGSTVWYRFTPTGNVQVQADTFGSGFDTVLAVYRGTTLDNLETLACNDDFFGLQSRLDLPLEAGTTYRFQVGGFGGATGDLVFNVGQPSTPTPIPTNATPTITPTRTATPIPITLTVNRTGTVSPDGFQVGLSGTLACTRGAGALMSVNAFKFARGQVILGAFGSAAFTCSGAVQSWAVTAESFVGFFKPGRANVRVILSTFGPFDQREVAANVRLRRGLPPPESPPESPPIFGAIASKEGMVIGGVLGSVFAMGLGVGFVKVLGPTHRRKDPEL